MRYLGADVEELMLLEAMRRSIQDASPTAPNASSSSTEDPQSIPAAHDASFSNQESPEL